MLIFGLVLFFLGGDLEHILQNCYGSLLVIASYEDI
jgi:type III secretory pathway component EscT